jgi:UPF0755 protein
MKLSKILSLISIVLVLVVSVVCYFAYDLFNGYPSNTPNELNFTINNKSTYSQLAKDLKDKNVIKNEWIFLQKAKEYKFLAIGDYTLVLPATNEQILEQTKKQSENIISNIKVIKTTTVLVKEGATVDDFIDSMVKAKLVPNPEEAQKYLKNPLNFDRTKYPFLPTALKCTYGDPNVCAKYYPEGFIYPATYTFEQGQSFEVYVNKTLDTFAKFAYPELKAAGLKDNELQSSITMASVIEKEAGYGTRDKALQEVKDVLKEERENMASVFNNRFNKGVMWQSNPTTHYGTPYKLCEQTIKVSDCVYLNDPKIANNKYSTYNNLKPIAPISNPSIESIRASFSNKKTNLMFFLADNTGKTRFAVTDIEHEKNIKDVNSGR